MFDNKYLYKQLFDTHQNLTGKELKDFINDNCEIEGKMSAEEKKSLTTYYKLAGYVRIVGGRRWELIEGRKTVFMKGKHIFYNGKKSDTIEVAPENLIYIYEDKI